MIALAFVLFMLLAIWLAVRLGGVRKREPGADGPVPSRRRKTADRADGGVWIGSGSDLPSHSDLADSEGIKAGGGSFGGGGASGDWSDAGDSGSSSGDGGGGD
jgi:uncharacterized membrane protein YgcG